MKIPPVRSIIISSLLLILVSISFRSSYKDFFGLEKMPKPFMYKEEWLTQGAGMHVLPAPVQSAVRMIDSTKISTYKTVGQYKQMDGAYWELTLFESAWPAKADSTSKNVIGFLSGHCHNSHHKNNLQS